MHLFVPAKIRFIQVFNFQKSFSPYLSLEVRAVTLAGHGGYPLTLPNTSAPGSNFCFTILTCGSSQSEKMEALSKRKAAGPEYVPDALHCIGERRARATTAEPRR